MKDNFIQLKEDNVLRLGIKDKNGNPTGEHLEFDLEDIELPLKYQELLEQIKKNNKNLKNEFIIIDKRQDVKGKKLYSKNEEDKIKVLQDYFKKQVEAYNMFLGENGVQKLLNGRNIGWTTLEEIDDIIATQISPYFDNTIEKITKKVKEKYGNFKVKKEDEIEVVE